MISNVHALVVKCLWVDWS